MEWLLRQMEETKTDDKSRITEAVPWGVMVGMYHAGNEEAAIASCDRGDVIEVQDGSRTLFAFQKCTRALCNHAMN